MRDFLFNQVAVFQIYDHTLFPNAHLKPHSRKSFNIYTHAHTFLFFQKKRSKIEAARDALKYIFLSKACVCFLWFYYKIPHIYLIFTLKPIWQFSNILPVKVKFLY